MASEYSGRCFCGFVRFRLEDSPLYACHCHCHSCQRAAGAAYVSWATFAVDAMRITDGVITEYQSSPGVTRGFCGHCGSALTYAHTARPGEIDVTLASLEDAEDIVLRSHIWVEDKAPWVVIADDLPQYPRKATG